MRAYPLGRENVQNVKPLELSTSKRENHLSFLVFNVKGSGV